ncbi:MAG: hypothetical protein AAF938_07915 [Myxococcota bacterium]
MTAWSVVRTAKFVGLALYFMGLAGSVIPWRRAERLRSVYWLLVPGFVVVYGAGWVLMRLSGRTLLAPWLAASAV